MGIRRLMKVFTKICVRTLVSMNIQMTRVIQNFLKFR